MEEVTPIGSRKSDHIRINLEEDVQSGLIVWAWSIIVLSIMPLPEINLKDVNPGVKLFGKTLSCPHSDFLNDWWHPRSFGNKSAACHCCSTRKNSYGRRFSTHSLGTTGVGLHLPNPSPGTRCLIICQSGCHPT